MSSGSDEYDLGTTGRGEDSLPFSGAGEAEEFLRQHFSDPDDLRKLRMAMTEEGSDPEMKNLDDHQILQAAARRIARGEIQVYPRAAAAPAFAVEEEEKNAAPAAREKTWVAFRVVEDSIGKPVPDLKLTVVFPDGSEREGMTDKEGKLELQDVPEGECTLTSPVEGATYEGTWAFMETGDKPVDQKPLEPPTPKKENKKPYAGPWWLVSLEPYEFKPGESLEQAAKAHSVSWKDISFFNWEITDSNEAKKHLDSLRPQPPQDGSSRGEHAQEIPVEIPSEPIDGPTVMVPNPIRLQCETLHTHTVRVRRLAHPYAFVSLTLYDDDWSDVLAERPYRLESATGEVFEGVTDKGGDLEHGPLEMALYRLTVSNVRLCWSPEPAPWVESTPEEPPPFPETPAVEPSENHPVSEFDLEESSDSVPDSEPDAALLVDESVEVQDEAQDKFEWKPVLGQATLLIPAVWEYQRPYPQRLPMVLADLSSETEEE